MMLTAERVLSNLPLTITVWTALTLCWGVYTSIAYAKILSLCGIVSRYHVGAMTCGNALMLAILLFQSRLIQYEDATIVLNTFFDAYLVATSITIGKWWKSVP